MTIEDKDLSVSEAREWLTSEDAYNVYCTHASTLGKTLDLPTYDEWVQSVLSDNPHKEMGLKLKFINNPSFTGAAGIAAGIIADRMGIDTSSAESAIITGSKILQREFARRANGGGRMKVEDPGSGGSGSGSGGSYNDGSPFNPTGLSLNAKPIESSWTTGIKVSYDAKYFLDGLDDTSPLIMKAFTPLIGDNLSRVDSRLDGYFDSKVMSDWITYFQLNGRWNLQTAGQFTKEKFRNWFNITSQGLSLYYFYTSIAAHFALEINRNEAMINLYKALPPTELNQLYILKNTLNTIPIPPELNEMCFKLYNNYKQSKDNPGSPLLKFCPIDSAVGVDNYVEFTQSLKVVDILEKIKQPDFRNIQAIIAQAKPEWATNVKLYQYTGLPNYDGSWLTLFVNSEYLCKTSTGLATVPQINESTDEWIYNIHTDAPDGWTQALSNVSVNGNMTPGFGGAVTLADGSSDNSVSDLVWTYNVNGNVFGTSCVIYTKDTNNLGSEVSGFFPISRRTRYQALSGNTYSILESNPTLVGFQKFGTTRVHPLTGNTNYVPAQQLFNLVFGPNQSSGPKGMDYSTETSDESPRKRRRKKK